MESKVYPARVDWWLWLILIGSTVGLILWGVFMWQSNLSGALILIGVGVFDSILFGVLMFPCYYAIEEPNILIRSGVLRFRVPIDGIESLACTMNPLSAPAPSLKRIEIRMKNGKFYLVSPTDREGFIRDVSRLAGIAAKD